MSKKVSPSERLKEIQDSPGKLREPDFVNEYLLEEEYITVVEERDGKRKYSVTQCGESILKRLE